MKLVTATPVAVVAAYAMDQVIFGGQHTIIVARMARTACSAFGFYI